MRVLRWLAFGVAAGALSAAFSLRVLRKLEAPAPAEVSASPAPPRAPASVKGGKGVLIDESGRRYETGAFAERAAAGEARSTPASAQLPPGPDRADRRSAVRLLAWAAAAALAVVLFAARRFKPRF